MQDGDWDSKGLWILWHRARKRVRIAWTREGRNKDERTGARMAECGWGKMALTKLMMVFFFTQRSSMKLSLEEFRFRCGFLPPPKPNSKGASLDVPKY